jgi:membrane protease YdiL (CAAX protease family)
MEKYKLNKLLYGIIAVLALFIVQVSAGKFGGSVADLFSYEKFDFYDAFAGISVHHVVQMIIALAIIVALSKLLKADFGFNLGDIKKGTYYLVVFTVAFTIITIIVHVLMLINNQLPVYDYPLNINNIMGTLGFQLFLSGTSEEILYRALPVTVLVYVFGKSVNIKWNITLEVILAAVLFSIAHTKWSLFPFAIEVDYFRLLYAFVLGTINGIAYQQSRSVLYPMLMHSISNVLMVGTGYLFIMFLA